MNVIDSSGWIEFFLAGANGPVFKPVIEQRNQLGLVLFGSEFLLICRCHERLRHSSMSTFSPCGMTNKTSVSRIRASLSSRTWAKALP